MKPWVQKYQPKKLNDIIGQSKAITEVYNFWRGFKNSRKKAALLYGPPGCGKTSLIHALAEQEALEVVEINASDFRNKDQIEKILKPATQQVSIFGARKIILVDEVDGMSGQKDRGGVKAIIEIIKKTKFPIIMTANDAWSAKLKTLRNYCNLISLGKLEYISITKYLMRICEKEDVQFEELALKKMAMSCDGDMRAAINDLQVMASDGKVTNSDLTIWGREREETMLNALKLIFKSFDQKIAIRAANELKKSDDILLWLEQNIPEEYDREALAKAFDAISWADIFKERIGRWQHWRFMIYVKFLSVLGVQNAKKGASRSFVSYKRPGVILTMWQRAAKRKKAQGLAQQLEGKLHCSVKCLQKDFMPYLSFIEQKNPAMYKKIADSLGI
jgi:replication factor C large subunit